MILQEGASSMKSNQRIAAALCVSLGVALVLPARAQEAVAKEELPVPVGNYSPNLDRNFPNRVFWGDTHLHTSYSTDAGMVGCTLGPEEAYRFGRGEEVRSSCQRARLSQSYDFLVVFDHAENLGLAPMIAGSDRVLLKN